MKHPLLKNAMTRSPPSRAQAIIDTVYHARAYLNHRVQHPHLIILHGMPVRLLPLHPTRIPELHIADGAYLLGPTVDGPTRPSPFLTRRRTLPTLQRIRRTRRP